MNLTVQLRILRSYLRGLRKIPPVFAVLLVPLAARVLALLDFKLEFLPDWASWSALTGAAPFLWLAAIAVIVFWYARPKLRFSLRTLVLAQPLTFFIFGLAASFGPWTKSFAVPGMPIGFSTDGRYVVATNPYSNPGEPFVWDARTGERTNHAAAPELHDPAVREAPNGMRVEGDGVRWSRTGAVYRFGGEYVLPLILSPSGREVLVWSADPDASLIPLSTELWRLTRRPEWWAFVTLSAFWLLIISACAFFWSLERDLRRLRRPPARS